MNMSPDDRAELKRRQRSRNIALGLILAGFVALFYFITIARMGG